jgi:chromosomal replication initiation ATPase DnaA
MKASEFRQVAYEAEYRPRATAGAILNAVAEHTGISPDLMRSRRRTPAIAWARKITCHLMRCYGHPAWYIGETLELDQTTACHHIRHVNELIEGDDIICRMVKRAISEMKEELGVTEADDE